MKLRDGIKIAAAALLLAVGTWFAVSMDRRPWFPPAPAVVKSEHYARIAAVYEGDIDIRFFVTKAFLRLLAPGFVNKPMLLGHEHADPNMCVGRIVESGIGHDAFGDYIEIIVKINNDQTVDLIKRNAYYSVSIGFMTLKQLCLIDAKYTDECGHQPGTVVRVNGKYQFVRTIPVDATALEVSFVNVPASPHARVLELADHPLHCSNRK